MDRDAKTVTLSDVTVSRTKLPEGLEVYGELGKGSNNKVFKAIWNGKKCVVRMPRRGSDTQQKGSALWELRHTLRASEMGVGPTVLAAWYARHATREFPSGLYFILERFDDDLETITCEDENMFDVVKRYRDDIEASIVKCILALAKDAYSYTT